MSKYYSKYSNDYCTIAQYLCEILLERKYSKKEDIELPFKFWNKSKYKKDYQNTIKQINKFFKLYNPEAVLNVFLKNEWIYSLFYPNLIKLILKEEELLNEKQEKANKINNIEGTSGVPKLINQEGKIGKLRKLDE